MNTLNRVIIGKRIKEIRNHENLSQMELAELADISNVYLSYIETGKKQISLNVLIKIANALNVTCDNILEKASIYSRVI